MAEPVFPHFVGCGRSGTTLFRNMFDAHPRLAMTHEAHFVGPMAKRRSRYETTTGLDLEAFLTDLYDDSNFRRQGLERETVREAMLAARPTGYADAVRVVFSCYAAAQGKEIYGDKTPGSVSHMDTIAELFPEARFVHIVRDGRAVALSYLERPEWGPQTMAEAANHWKSRVRRGRASGARLGPTRYREARYEDLLDDPVAVLEDLCQFLDIEYSDEMLRYHERGREFVASTADPGAFENLTRPVTRELRDWRAEMSEPDLALFEAIAGAELADFGYETAGEPPTLATRARVAAAALAWQRKRLFSVVGPSRGGGSGTPAGEVS